VEQEIFLKAGHSYWSKRWRPILWSCGYMLNVCWELQTINGLVNVKMTECWKTFSIW